MKYRDSRKKTLLTVVIATVMIALFGVGIHALEGTMGSDVPVGSEEDSAEAENVLVFGNTELNLTHNLESYLMMGTDDSGNEEAVGTEDYEGAMADFLLLLVVDRTDNTYGFLQIDRNTIAEVPYMDREGNGDDTIKEQICTAHWYGANPEQGCGNTVDAVSMLLGELPIDGYYSIHMSDIGILNQAVGGVTVTLDDDFSSMDPAMKKGATVTLTDEQAQIYVRGRMEVGDGTNEERMSRQLQFMEDFKTKARAKMKADSGFAQRLLEELSGNAVTNLSGRDLSVIINQIYKNEDLGILQLQGKTKEGTTLNDGKIHEEFYPEEASIIRAIKTLCGVDEAHVVVYDDED